ARRHGARAVRHRDTHPAAPACRSVQGSEPECLQGLPGRVGDDLAHHQLQAAGTIAKGDACCKRNGGEAGIQQVTSNMAPTPSPQKLRVLFLASRDWYHPATTGGDITLWENARYLASIGHDVTFVAARYAGAPQEE